jgi:hypothetical protein
LIITDVPFARLDAILLLIKNHLKGRIPEMLNSKDNQVFMDYLAGGQSRQVAMEREANAASGGVLSVAARNLVVADEDEGKDVAMKEVENAKGELQVVASLAREVKGLPETFKEIRKEFSELEEVKLQYGKKGHDQKLQFKREEVELETELETKKQEFEVKKRKQNMQLLLEEAEVERQCKAIREGKLVLGDNNINKRHRGRGGSLISRRRRGSVSSSSESESESESDSEDDNRKYSSSCTKEQAERLRALLFDDEEEEQVASNEKTTHERDEEAAVEANVFNYDMSKEEGLTTAAIKARREFWNKLADMHNYVHNDDWMMMIDSSAKTPQQRTYEEQLLQRVAKYEEEQRKVNKVVIACCKCLFLFGQRTDVDFNFCVHRTPIMQGGHTSGRSLPTARCGCSSTERASTCWLAERC